jgi:hypothetical protein
MLFLFDNKINFWQTTKWRDDKMSSWEHECDCVDNVTGNRSFTATEVKAVVTAVIVFVIFIFVTKAISDYCFSGEINRDTTLNNYSWAELKTIADDLSENGEGGTYYSEMLGLMKKGSVKTFIASSSITGISETVQVRIIGICQDQKSDGTGVAGLTFQTTHSLQLELPMDADGELGWGSTSLRSQLNRVIFESFPSELRENIVSVKKYYNSEYDSTLTGTVTYSNDKLSLLSACELFTHSEEPFVTEYTRTVLLKRYRYNATSYANCKEYPWYDLEGTGENHDEQYQYYAYKKVKREKENTVLATQGMAYNDWEEGQDTSFWWLRSTCVSRSGEVQYLVTKTGVCGMTSPDLSCNISPAFCL